MFARLAYLSTTRFNYWLGFVFDGTICLALFAVAVTQPEMTPLKSLATFTGGLFIFSFIEYFFHRWLFHQWVEVMKRGHWAHHEDPLGYDALPFFVPSLVYLALAVFLQFFMPLGHACLLASSVALGYITYGLTHYALHHFRFKNILGKKLLAHHQIHHYHPEYNFGVTSPLWDLVLGTRYRSRHRRLW